MAFNWETTANLAAAGSFIIAAGAYLYDFWKKKSKISKLKSLINLELRSLYRSIRKDIIKYNKVRKSEYKDSFQRSIYNLPFSKNLIRSGMFLNFFDTKEEYSCFSIIIMLIEDIENSDQDALKRSEKKILDFFFKNRLVELRETLIELSEHSQFVKLEIIPKEHAGMFSSLRHIEKYNTDKENEEHSLEIINKNIPELNCRKLPSQHIE